ncbi:MAG TPA: hypothetical protein VJO13_09645 [Ktedonobacterales bacterium]|nr:hypothetical protein [Ktedonobacterales bacterium]
MRRRTVEAKWARRLRYGVVCLVCALAVLLAGCGGATGATTYGPGAGSQPTKVVGHAQESGVSTATFTTSGGLSGQTVLSMDINAGNPGDLISYHLAAEKRFYLDLTDQSGSARQQFILDFIGYTGPGKYTVSPVQAGAAADEAVHFELIVPGSDLGNNLWLIDKSAAGTCSVEVISVTPIAHLDNAPSAPGSHPTLGYSEVDGSITCPSVPVYLADGTPPLTVSSGHFDVLMVEEQ